MPLPDSKAGYERTSRWLLALADKRLRQHGAPMREDARYDRGSVVLPALQAAAIRLLACSNPQAGLPDLPKVQVAPGGIRRSLAGIGDGALTLQPRLLSLAWVGGALVADGPRPGARSQERAPMPMRGTHIAPAPLPAPATHAAVAREIRTQRRASNVRRVWLDVQARKWVAREDAL